MKKLIAVSLLTAVMLLTGGFVALAHAQAPANDLKPTFISPTPGVYVNGWPAFTVSYPKEWVEQPTLAPGCVFTAGVARPDLPPGWHHPLVTIAVGVVSIPLEDWAKIMMPWYVLAGTDIKVLSDKPTHLKDGTPAREVQLEWVTNGSMGTGAGLKRNDFHLITKKDQTFVDVQLGTGEEKIGEDLKRIAYSLTFLPGREEPVKVPPDVRAFLDMWCVDMMSHDLKTIMAHFSDRFRHSGTSKPFIEQVFRNDPFSPIRQSLISCKPTVTVFEARGDKAYVDGFILNVDKVKGETTTTKIPMLFQQIINEHGQWKWFGNQK